MKAHNAFPICRRLAAMAGAILTAGAILMFAGPASALAQHCSPASSLQSLAQGTKVPVELTRTLKAGSLKVGSRFVAKTAQRIPVAPHVYLPGGVEIVGEVIASEAGNPAAGRPSVLTFRFNQIRYKGQTTPFAARTVAVANFVQVMDATEIATGSTDRGNPSPAGWTTNQVGGDQVYRSGWRGDVYSSYSHKVGFVDYHGVYASPAEPGELPQALGVFSTTSTGLFGFGASAKLSVEGTDTTVSDSSARVTLRNGDNLMLKVLAGAPAR